MEITAAIITLNEERNIERALASVAWADEVLVVDSGSTDATRELASAAGARVIERAWNGFAEQKQFAADEAANDWIFSLDADEAASDELIDEIAALKSSDPGHDGYRIPRLSYYLGREIRHSGWYPDHQLRLFNRRKGGWKNVLVHESVEMLAGSTIGKLSGNILHFTVDDVAHHHRMIGERYAPLAARQMLLDGRRTSKARIFLAGPLAFLRSYVWKAGFLDGFPGYCIARFAADHAYLKHLMLWEMARTERRSSNPEP